MLIQQSSPNWPVTSQTPVSSIQESSPGIVTGVDVCAVVEIFFAGVVVEVCIAVVLGIESVDDGAESGTTYPKT